MIRDLNTFVNLRCTKSRELGSMTGLLASPDTVPRLHGEYIALGVVLDVWNNETPLPPFQNGALALAPSFAQAPR